MSKLISFIGKAIAWVISIFMSLIFSIYFPHWSSFLMLLFVLILVPVEALQKVWRKLHIKGGLKVLVLGILFILAVLNSPDPEEAPEIPEPATAQIQTEETAQENTVTETIPETTKEEQIPYEYKAALKKAESYSDLMQMSKAGIYHQLTSEYGENFPADAAQYAIDNMVADWNENALAKAYSYSETMHMSKKGIYNQLISEYGEQFTPEEAQYAIDNIRVDWNENALQKAKDYMSMSMSLADIRNQLISEYGEQFTAEEADYAISKIG